MVTIIKGGMHVFLYTSVYAGADLRGFLRFLETSQDDKFKFWLNKLRINFYNHKVWLACNQCYDNTQSLGT